MAPLGTNALLTVIAIETVLLALILTSLDDDVVRFMAIAGHGAQRIRSPHHGNGDVPRRSGAEMLDHASAGRGRRRCCCTCRNTVLLTLRLIAYRLHAKRFADLLVSILAGLLMMVAYSVPVALPVIAVATLWQLQSRGRKNTATDMNVAINSIVELSGRRVVEGVHLTVSPESWFALLGANGLGKTSVLRALAGRLPFAGGTCRIKGEELAEHRAARGCAWILSTGAVSLMRTRLHTMHVAL
jgi:hypothetical protein